MAETRSWRNHLAARQRCRLAAGSKDNLPVKFRIQWHDQLPSTNTYLKETLAAGKDGVPSGTVVATRWQTHGRGRYGREWLSAPDENLSFSVFLQTRLDLRKRLSASMAAAVAVAELLEEKGLRPELKWPNDVLVGGKKICGILSEGIPSGVIVGIGLNVNMKSFDRINQIATSILLEAGRSYELNALLDGLLGRLSALFDQWLQSGFPGIRSQWESRMPGIGRTVSLSEGSQRCSGVLQGLGDDGELLLRDAQGAVRPVWVGGFTATDS